MLRDQVGEDRAVLIARSNPRRPADDPQHEWPRELSVLVATRVVLRCELCLEPQGQRIRRPISESCRPPVRRRACTRWLERLQQRHGVVVHVALESVQDRLAFECVVVAFMPDFRYLSTISVLRCSIASTKPCTDHAPVSLTICARVVVGGVARGSLRRDVLHAHGGCRRSGPHPVRCVGLGDGQEQSDDHGDPDERGCSERELPW